MSLPNGIQPLVLWEMDGRTWIEPMADPSQDDFRGRHLARCVERGWATIIPVRLVEDFIGRVKAYDRLEEA